MRLLLLIAVYFIAVLHAFPMCTDGQTPLMEANDAFTCDRGCPVGFNCEFQDPGRTLSKAICCANITALQLLYEDGDHSEPIWNLSEVSGLSRGLQSPSENEEISEKTKKPEYKAPSIAPTTMEEVNPTLKDKEEPHMMPEETVNTESTMLQAEDVPAPPPPDSVVIAQQQLLETEGIPESNATDLTEPIESVPNILISSIESVTSKIPIAMELENSTLDEQFPTKIEIELEGSGDLSEEQSKRLERIISCERQQYRIFCHSGKTRTLATIRWWFNEEKGECEFYPFGYCPGDRIVESTTIRTKKDCELRCRNEAIDDIDVKFDKAETVIPLSRPALEEETNTGTSALFDLEDNNVVFKDSENKTAHTESVSEETTTSSIEDLHLPTVDNLPSAEGNNLIAVDDPRSADSHSFLKELSESQKENVESAEPALTGKDLKAHIASSAAESEETTTVKMESVTDSDTDHKNLALAENDLEKMNEIISENKHETQTESTEGILKIEPSEEKHGLLCSSTSYRYACKSGMPSQFVYRWEMVNGKCQSFPYGYCYGEFNHGHPRTPKECNDLCTTPSMQFFAL